MTTNAVMLAGLLVVVVVIVVCTTVLIALDENPEGLAPLAAFALGLIASLVMRKGESS